jgi:hypothetical protein
MEYGLQENYNGWMISVSGQNGRYSYAAEKDGLYLSNTISAVDQEMAMAAVKLMVDAL